MLLRAQRVAAFAVLLITSAACTNSHDVLEPVAQPSVAGERATIAETASGGQALCERLAELQCSGEQRCCERPGRALEACRSARSAECEQNAHLDEVAENPVTGFDAAAADSVFAALEQKLLMCDPEILSWSASETGLRSLFKGSVSEGQSCKPAQLINASESQQAAALLSCRNAASTACLPASLLGGWSCTSKSTQSGNCVTDDNCASDTYCAMQPDAVFGTCQARLVEAAACASATQCRSFTCIAGQCAAPDVQYAFCPSAS